MDEVDNDEEVGEEKDDDNGNDNLEGVLPGPLPDGDPLYVVTFPLFQNTPSYDPSSNGWC